MFGNRRRRTSRRLILQLIASALLAASLSACGNAESASTPTGSVALILKTETNPFFVTIRQAAQAQAEKSDLQMTVSAGAADGDVDSQIAAIDAAIERGDSAILITPNGPGVDGALKRAREDHEIFVVALDTKPGDPQAADITYATDNFKAGQLIGAWAAAKLKGQPAVIALLDLFGNRHVESDYDRDQGFLTGMGIPVADYQETGDESPTGDYSGGTYRIACQEPTLGSEDGGRAAMEQCLQLAPDINLVYTINEPAAAGAAEVLQAAGQTATMVSVDGGCDPGMRLVAEGVIGATSQQAPRAMAIEGVDAIADYLADGTLPIPNSGVDMIDTGVELVTNDPQPGVPSIDVTEGLARCWGAV